MTGSLVATVLGVDPGRMTGLAVVELYRRPDLEPTRTMDQSRWALFRTFYPVVLASMTVEQSVYTSALRVVLQTLPSRAPGTPLVISCEKYIVTRLTAQSQDTQALEVTSATTTVAEILEVPYHLVKYAPSVPKSLFADDRMRDLGYEIKHMDDHARDALRHALMWCTNYVMNREQLPKIDVDSGSVIS